MNNRNELKEKAALAAFKHYGSIVIINNVKMKLDYMTYLIILNNMEEYLIYNLGSNGYLKAIEYFFDEMLNGEKLSKMGIECFDTEFDYISKEFIAGNIKSTEVKNTLH